MKKFASINHLLDESRRRFADRPALGTALGAKITYEELGRRVAVLAARLAESYGAGPGATVAIVSENCVDWCVCYLAVLKTGAAAVPILPDFPDADVRHIVLDAQVSLVFASQRQLDKLVELDPAIPVILIGPAGRPADEVPHLDSVIGADDAKTAPPHPFPEADENTLASIIYTSGTSGHSKGVMLTHGNLCANVHAASQLLRVLPDWIFLSLLPISHAYEFTIGFMLPLLSGACVVYANRTPTPAILEKICAAERPSAICVVPMIMEKIYKKRVLAQVLGSPLLGLMRKIPGLRTLMWRIIGGKLLKFFGGRLEVLAIGGAALGMETEMFLRRAAIPFIVGYGLTETSPLVAAGPFGAPDIAPGSCGRPVPGVEVDIHRPGSATGIGEIKVRGEGVMRGYHNQPELTARVIDAEGWFYTGDLGFIDKAGNLHIKGRSKSVIVLSHGENIYPETIEERINALPMVAESLVVARENRLMALIYLDYDFVDQETGAMAAGERGEYIKGLLARIKKEVNAALPAYSRLYAALEHPEPFIKTATHKIKRYLYEF